MNMRNNPQQQQQQPRNLGDFECGGMPMAMTRLWGLEGLVVLSHMYRIMIHIERIELPKYRINPVMNNEKLRVSYMLNEIDQNEFKVKIQRKEKEAQKFTDIYDIFQMIHTTGAMYLRELKHIESTIPERTFTIQNIPTRVMEIIDEMENIRIYANRVLTQVSDRYSGCKVPWIAINWTEVSVI
jgi:hypothetical protein